MTKARRNCSCGWCKLCVARHDELERIRAHIRDYCEQARLRRSAGERRLPAERARAAPQVQLTGEMRQALREAIDARRRERLPEFSR